MLGRVAGKSDPHTRAIMIHSDSWARSVENISDALTSWIRDVLRSFCVVVQPLHYLACN
jgi:hypothetical protein